MTANVLSCTSALVLASCSSAGWSIWSILSCTYGQNWRTNFIVELHCEIGWMLSLKVVSVLTLAQFTVAHMQYSWSWSLMGLNSQNVSTLCHCKWNIHLVEVSLGNMQVLRRSWYIGPLRLVRVKCQKKKNEWTLLEWMWIFKVNFFSARRGKLFTYSHFSLSR